MRVLILKKMTIIKCAVCLLLIIIGVVAAKLMFDDTEEVFGPAQQNEMVTGVNTETKVVALTFDTTFGNDRTEQILEILDAADVKCTFAVMGAWANENPETVQAIVDDGHELISHSMSHGRYNDMSDEEMLEDAKAARAMLAGEYGANTSYIRPPYGALSSEKAAVLWENGFIPVKWSIDAMDWQGDGSDAVTERVLSAVQPGSIIVMQNNSEDAVGALLNLVKQLEKQGYQMVTLSELMAMDDSAGASVPRTSRQPAITAMPTGTAAAVEPSKQAS